MGEGADGGLLDQIIFRHAPRHLGLQQRVLALQPIPCLLGLQLGAHPGLDDGGVDGLGDVIGGAEGQPLLLAARIGEGGEQHHGNGTGGRI
ncbi:hypothetical protein D3C80_1580200 [compost metagenome]